MLELPINQYNITEIKYKLNDEKTVTFKLNNFMLKDVEVEEKTENIQIDPPVDDEEKDDMSKTMEASRKKEWKEDLEKNKIDSSVLLTTLNDNKSEVQNATDKEIDDFNRGKYKMAQQYKIDKTIIDEHEGVKEKKIKNNFDKLSNVDKDRCKEIMDAIDKIPYRVIEKVGTLHTFKDGDVQYEVEEDPYFKEKEKEVDKNLENLKLNAIKELKKEKERG